jgi:hypothetical protein
MNYIKNEENPSGADIEVAGPRASIASDLGVSNGSSSSIESPFPEVSSIPLRVLAPVERNQKETDLEIGLIRLKVLLPFALSRLGKSYEVWDKASNGLVWSDAPLAVRTYARELSSRLSCGLDFIFKLIGVICAKGPENVAAEDMLKDATSGGRGTSRLLKSEEQALQSAVYKVCVTDGQKPSSKAANNFIRAHLLQVGSVSRRISTKTIRSRALSQHITTARTDAYQRDHLNRIAGQPDEVLGLNSVVVLDSTQFSDADRSLRVVDSKGRDLGAANVIFGILKSNRGIWSFRAFAGSANRYLAGLTIKRGLVSKAPLLERYNISGIWPFHGKPGALNHDNGSEFVNDHIIRVLKSRDIGYKDLSPPKTPHFRGTLERFNRSAHVLFSEFLGSDFGKRYLRTVNGRPKDQGILLNDLDRAMAEWIVCHYHHRPHRGLGGDSPISRMEKLVLGLNGLPSSGVPTALEDTEELTWDFLWEETRVVNHLGIRFHNRRYVNTALSALLKHGHRSSQKKITFRFNPYAMRWIFVKVPTQDGGQILLRVEWLPENEKYRPQEADQMLSINPSLWEWEAIFKDICRGNSEKPTGLIAEQMLHKREAEAAADTGVAGAPGKSTRMSECRNRAMREEFGKGNNPTLAVTNSDFDIPSPVSAFVPESFSSPRAKKKQYDLVPKLLMTEGGADAY